ncbi:MAG: hypothetical protein DM484_23755 [Candidatus Methylumidiphilus alinenensis]|uniref:site-specific DNA-methyltransferase (adenine-specific) n=1 Tax=Candidatus Methylumidiphilus alinenensis TaxID=2202197 RepID=A0A2W4QLG9_9GAMM|nr:MAG: hypothetical protein DM484_23755 [Candidatus Methylumidiphilus alinenensis]
MARKRAELKENSKKNGNGANIGFEAQLFLAADKLRGNLEPSDYKHVVLGLIFLKYISDAFEAKHAALLAEDPLVAEDADEYLAENVFWVPKEARWSHLQANAKQPTIDKLIDDAMIAIEANNTSLKGVLPKDYNRPALNKVMLGELIDLASGIAMHEQRSKARDILGRVYEYFLGGFAGSEGKRGGEFYTPRSVVRVLVEMLEPYQGRVYDPCCGSGGMFVQSEKFVEEHGGRIGDIAIYGQESNYTTWRLAKMNLAVRGIDAEIRWNNDGSFHKDKLKDLRFDYILANPPFNISDWGGDRLREDARWKYGVPPVGNANYAWLQHILWHLSQNGTAGVVLANGSMSSSIAIGPFGSRMKADTYVNTGIPVIRGTNISDSIAWKGEWVYISEEMADSMPNCIVKYGDLVFPHRGSIGEVAIIPDDALRYMISTSLMKITVDAKKANSLFLYYYFRSSLGRQEILKYSSQVGTPGIGQPLSSLKQFRVPLPPLHVQKGIADIIGVLDDLFDRNKKTNETLEAMARLFFKDWFLDFGPTRAKAEGRLAYLAPDLWSLFPDALDDDDKPIAWETSTIGQEVRVVGGTTPSTKEPTYWNGEFCWATPKDLSSLKTPVLLSTERRITQAGISQIGSGLLPIGTVLLSSRAPIGYLVISQVETAVNQGFIAMVCEGRLSNVLVWLWTQANMEVILQKANGSTFQEISKANFRPIPVTVADSPIHRAFDEIAQPIYKQIVANEQESRTLAQARDLLLAKLLSGEIRLQEAEKIVEQAL